MRDDAMNKEKICKYLIMDDSDTGTVVAGGMEHTEMLLLLGMICLDVHDASEVVRTLCGDFRFAVVEENLPAGQGMPDVVLDACSDEGLCSRADISAIREYFSASDTKAMLRSVDWSDFVKTDVA